MSESQTENLVGHQDLLRMTTEMVAAYLGKNDVAADRIPDVIQTVYGSLKNLDSAPIEAKAEPQKPAVPWKKSVFPDYIVCLEDGRKLKMLKRHLRTVYGMTPDDYRQKWALPADYPMVAPSYAKQRSEFAKQIGLGRVSQKAAPKAVGRRRKGTA